MVSKHRTSRAQVTLGRALSKLGVSSRAQAGKLLQSGRVAVNGHVIKDAELWIDLRSDRVAVDGVAAMPRVKRYFVMNKPAGVVTSRSDERGRRTVYDLLPADAAGCFPVGRLDRDTSGLLLFTSDTAFGEFITSPATKVPKTYIVALDAPVGTSEIELVERGMTLRNGTRYRPARMEKADRGNVYSITIAEGKNRQIRRMMQEIGRSVIALTRIAIGSIALGSLGEGRVRRLTESELASLEWQR